MKHTERVISALNHTYGCIYDIIPDLIEIGIDDLNPIKTEYMILEILKEKYDDKIRQNENKKSTT